MLLVRIFIEGNIVFYCIDFPPDDLFPCQFICLDEIAVLGSTENRQVKAAVTVIKRRCIRYISGLYGFF